MTSSLSIGGDLVPTINANNNFAGTNTFSGTQFNIKSSTSGVQVYHWTQTTTDGTTFMNAVTITTSSNTTTMANTAAQGFCTVGTSINNGLSRHIESMIVNVAGTNTVTNATTYNNSTTLSGTGLSSSGIFHTASTNTFIVQVRGTASQTITWTGTTYVYN